MKRKNEETFGGELFKLAKKYGKSVNNAEDLQNVWKEGFKEFFENALMAEFDHQIGYQKHERSNIQNRRNGYDTKELQSSFGGFNIQTPRDRNSEFEPHILPKRQKNIADVEQKIINMYGLGMSTRDIVKTIKDIFGFDLNPSYISKITDKILPQIENWKSKNLDKIYPFVFIDGMRFKIRSEGVGKEVTCYIILGINMDGIKEFIGYWIDESESSKHWLSIFNEIKSRGVEKIYIVSCDNLPGISDAIKRFFLKNINTKMCYSSNT